MTDLNVEVAREGETAADPSAVLFEWPLAAGRSPSVRTDLDWHLSQLGPCAPAARDLLRVAFAAYTADRCATQPAGRLGRALRLTVHVEEPALWTAAALERTVDLLHWLSGDDWALRVVPAAAAGDGPAPALDFPAADDVSLLSGGLDSLCGALVRVHQSGTVLFLGHADTATSVRRAQRRIAEYLHNASPPQTYEQYALRPIATLRNHVPKTRSLLFMAMAVAAATGTGAARVLVPENGFTSINPPLEPSRGGAMTTRSTHPWTFHALAGLLAELGLEHVAVANPHSALTKGELFGLAMPSPGAALLELAAATVSCAKINAGRPAGGDANTQCGLCVACLVRRAAFIGAGVPDLTPYTCDTLGPEGRTKVRTVRRHDVAAWASATRLGVPEHRVLASAVWPPGTDLDAVLALCDRGLEELSRVPV